MQARMTRLRGTRLAGWALLALGLLFTSVASAQEQGEDFDHTSTRFVLTGAHMGVPCEGCHSRGVFRGTPTECGFCHDGSGMRAESGKPFDHIQSSNRCEDCHVTFSWPEARMDHTAVSGTCKGCHNGVQAQGTPPGHITTTADCDACHNTFEWSGVRFDHSNVMGSCSSCHNGVTATGKPTNHFITMQECDACHTTRAWLPDTFRHMSANYPGDHARNLDCRECHPGYSETVVYTDDPSLAPDCAGCHRNDFKQDAHKKYENPDTFYTVQELRDCTGSCHIYTDSSLTTIKTFRNSEHRVSDRSFD